MVLLTIIANCIVLALEEHLPEFDKTPLAVQLVSMHLCLFSSTSRFLTSIFMLCYVIFFFYFFLGVIIDEKKRGKLDSC